jgi:pimeloyl-ACP methyl ester carboxylesterase
MKHLLTFTLLLLFSTACYGQESSSFNGVDYPFEMSFADLQNGETIAYYDSGAGKETLVLIHCLGSYAPAWLMNIGPLSESNRVIALDLPGYGKSTKIADNYTLSHFAESVSMLMNKLEVASATVIGHSMGGQIAIHLANSYPKLVERLVLSAPAGFEQFTDQDKMLFRATVSAEAIAATPEAMVRQNMQATFYEITPDADFMIEDRLQMMKEPEFENYARAQAESVFAMLNEPVWDIMPNITQPVLVVFGLQDALIPNPYLHPALTTEGVANDGSERLQNSTLKLIDDAGHFVHFEKPDEFNGAVLEFLNQ